ncbi:MAG: hypothetical protein ACRDQI_11840 [Pseudonocardiaceae bacterium]
MAGHGKRPAIPRFLGSLGLAIARRRAATSVELAARAGIDERYGREWLCAMTAHSYLHHDRSKRPWHAELHPRRAAPRRTLRVPGYQRLAPVGR